MIELLAKLIDFFEKITIKRVFIFIIFTLLLIAFFPVIDHFFYFNIRTNSRLEILDKITKLDIERIYQNDILKEEYNSIIDDIYQHNKGFNFNFDKILVNDNGSAIIKFISGGFWCWIIVLFSPLIYKRDGKNMFIAFLLFAILGLIFGFISIRVPIIYNPLINYLGIPISQLIIILILVVQHNKKKKKI